jgi:outer membrane protein assembly factor BamB
MPRQFSAALCALLLTAGTARAERVAIGRYAELHGRASGGLPYATSGGDARRSGRSRLRVPGHEPNPVWSVVLPQTRLSPPAVLADGTLIVGGSAGVHALDPNTGAARWFAQIGRVRYTPSITADGAIVAAADGRLFVLSQAGAARALSLPFAVIGMPLVLESGEVIVVGRDGRAHAVALDGAVLGSLPAGAAPWTVLLEDGLFASAGPNTRLVLLSPASGQRREVVLPERLAVSPLAGPEPLLWALSERGAVWQLGPGGELRESARIGDSGIAGAPALGWDGALRVGLRQGEVVCIDASGSQRWRRGVDSPPGPILIDADDTALLVSARGTLYAIDRKGELRFRHSLDARAGGRPVLGRDGTIYVTFRGGRIDAFR